MKIEPARLLKRLKKAAAAAADSGKGTLLSGLTREEIKAAFMPFMKHPGKTRAEIDRIEANDPAYRSPADLDVILIDGREGTVVGIYGKNHAAIEVEFTEDELYDDEDWPLTTYEWVDGRGWKEAAYTDAAGVYHPGWNGK